MEIQEEHKNIINNEIVVPSKRGRPTTKNGNYDNKAYYQAFKEKNKAKINESVICDVCKGKYKYYNRSHHNCSKLHKNALALINILGLITDKVQIMVEDKKEELIE